MDCVNYNGVHWNHRIGTTNCIGTNKAKPGMLPTTALRAGGQ